MDREQRQVRDFHEKFAFTTNDIPTIIDPDLFDVRHDHTLSELQELKDAYYLIRFDGETEEAYNFRRFVKISDAIVDAVYFLKGTGVAFGIDLEPIFEEIHRSNMTKTKPEGDAKAIKGPDYSPPTLRLIIKRQLKETNS